ncbi:uncharacterized protein LOC130800386 isoform X1 [Amaranthus tricolor]|uniref:uncharacterized protein LOC130800386 isoform X1 n=1 Tax=Amaranthus tricolor TaxID=29722 RepID=UPI002583F8DE|nr:uncharacterized protein LOC130800386 isoform X1 [Amaranthus tricolor]XP_057519856.1 uncharacterized protein LOC130800386 isoform X1 [Amaranthus tricolor]
MEQSVTERPLSQEQCFRQVYNGVMNSNSAHLDKDQSENWCPKSLTDGDHLRLEKPQIPICRDNLRGACARGEYCKFQHSGSVEHDGSRFYQNDRGRLSYRETNDSDSRTRLSYDGFRSRSPCRKFQRGMCYRGSSCSFSHTESVRYGRSTYGSRVEQKVDGAVKVSGFAEGRRDSASGQRRSISPCRNFLRGHCKFGSFCRRWHPESRHDLSSSNPVCREGGRDFTLRASQGHDKPNMHKHSRTKPFFDDLRKRSPCQNFLHGRCYLGDSCVKLHPVREVCLQFTKGRCTNGDSCRYLHGYHAYASSVWNKNPIGAAGGNSNFSMENNSNNTIINQEHDAVTNSNMSLGESKNIESCVKETKMESVNNSISKILDEKVDASVTYGSKCEISEEKIARFCSPTERHEDFSLWSRPFKRRRSRSRSPFSPKDHIHCRNFRRCDSRIDLYRDRGYNVARFQYNCSSFKYERATYHANTQHHSKAQATSVHDRSCEASDSKVVLPHGHGVVNQCLQTDPCPNGNHGSNVSTVNEKHNAVSVTCALQPNCTDQNDKELAVDRSQSTVVSSQEDFESDSTRSCEHHFVSPEVANLTMLVTEENVDVTGNLDRERDETNAEFMPAIKTCSKERKKKHHGLVSCEDAMKEVADALKHGVPNSENNDLEDMVVHDSQHKQQEIEVTDKIGETAESTLPTTDDKTLVVGNTVSHSLQASHASPKAIIPLSRRKLLVLDVNGILADIVGDYPSRLKPDTIVSGKGVFKRPFCDDFIKCCFERFDVGIWSSRANKNVTRIVDFLLRDNQKRLLFCWDQSHCTATGYTTIENRKKPLVLKELKNLWDNNGETLPWKKGTYNETNTVLLDDSPYKALRNPPYTSIFPYPYSFKDARDKSLGPGGNIRAYLERLAEAENVQKFIQENPFGQRPITEANLSWAFYAKIVETGDVKQQEEIAKITTSGS